MHVKSLQSRPTLCGCNQPAPLSMEFSRQGYWSGLLCPASGDLPDPAIEPRSPTLLVDSLPLAPPGKPYWHCTRIIKKYMNANCWIIMKGCSTGCPPNHVSVTGLLLVLKIHIDQEVETLHFIVWMCEEWY